MARSCSRSDAFSLSVRLCMGASGGAPHDAYTLSHPLFCTLISQVGAAMEVIPRTLAQNCGANVIRTLTKLRAKVCALMCLVSRDVCVSVYWVFVVCV